MEGMQEELLQLRRGGLYWLACDHVTVADRFARQLLAGLPAQARAAAVVAGRSPDALLDGLGSDQGPGELTVLHVPAAQIRPALENLPAELERAMASVPPLLLVSIPAAAWEDVDDSALDAWCAALRGWLERGRHTLLVLAHGDVSALCTRLFALNAHVAGLAQAYRSHGGLRYLLHFWSNGLGVQAAREFALEQTGDALTVSEDLSQAAAEATGSDQRSYLAQRSVLEGAPPLSSAWRLFEDWAALAGHAARAQASSILFAIDGNSQVEELARLLYALRRERGRALKLVVREMAPCLRYADERLLLASGATLVVPHGTQLSRFLTMLDTIHGHTWQRQLPEDFATALQDFRPPPVCGVVSAEAFAAQVHAVESGRAGRNLIHSLVVLEPMPGLNVANVLGQCVLRRDGDLACIAGPRIYLFLFACRRDGVERALDNLFRLPWRELVAGYHVIADYDLAEALRQTATDHAAAAAAPPLPAAAARDDTEAAPHAPVPLAPQCAPLPGMDAVP